MKIDAMIFDMDGVVYDSAIGMLFGTPSIFRTRSKTFWASAFPCAKVRSTQMGLSQQSMLQTHRFS